MIRRNFLRNSGLALAGISLGPTARFSKLFSPESMLSRLDQDSDILKKARQDIAKIRKSDVEIKLIDTAGNPVKNTSVEIVQLKQSFLFGDCNPGMDELFRKYNGSSEKLVNYRRLFAGVMNSVNSTCYWTERPRNNMAKTEEYQGEPYYEGFADTVNWANSNGLTVKGHPLFWPVEKAIPDWLKKYPYDTQLKFLEVRLRELVSRFRGKVRLWDAVNEMLWEPALKNLKLRHWPHIETMDNMVEYISFVMNICREEDPDALYTLNDYGLEIPKKPDLKTKDGTVVSIGMQRKRYIELIKRLSEKGMQPNALGLQCHDGWMTFADQMAFYDEMATAGLPLHVTEFWAQTDQFQKKGERLVPGNGDFTAEAFTNSNAPTYTQDEIDNIQAEYIANYLTCAFSHPAIDAFLFWGFMGAAVTWKPEDSPSYELKPVYTKVRKLINEEWKTNLTAVTDSNGIVKFNGFFGDYSLRYPLKSGLPDKSGVLFSVNKYQAYPLTLRTSVL